MTGMDNDIRRKIDNDRETDEDNDREIDNDREMDKDNEMDKDYDRSMTMTGFQMVMKMDVRCHGSE